MRAIFVSYRRNDAEGEAGRLFDDLVREFGKQSVFMDVSTIQAGRDFRKVIDESVATCGVLLAVIGVNWVDAKDDAGHRRLDDPADFVRLETASALKRDIPVIPVLVRGARMPAASQLPDDLKDLAYRNAVEITHARWNSDVSLLIDTLRQLITEPTTTEPPATKKVVDGGDGKSRRVAVAIAAAAAILAAAAGGYFLLPGRSTAVPDLTGRTVAQATAELGAAHLSVGATRTQIDPSKPPDTIISQSPAANASVRQGSKVDLVLSPTLVEVPDVVGKSLNAAEDALRQRQLLKGDVQLESQEGAAANSVLREFPPAGESAKPGTKIDLVVAQASASQPPKQPQQPASAQPALARVPNLVGQTLDQARTQLSTAGLELGSSTTQTQEGTPAGTVLGQVPDAGRQVQKGTRVDVTVAQLPKQIRVEAHSTPQAVPAGGQAQITIIVRDLEDAAIPDAYVSVGAGGGSFSGGGTNAGGNTDSSGAFRTSWHAPNPAANGYVMGVTAKKVGYGSATTQLKVDVVLTPPITTRNPFFGNWRNADPATRGITRISIGFVKGNVASGQPMQVHAWANCSPTECDWGAQGASLSNDTLFLTWDQGFVNRRMSIRLDGARLMVTTDSIYRDARKPQHSVEYFVR